MDVFGEVSLDHENPDIYHVFYPDNGDSLIDATLDLGSEEVVYLREDYDLKEHEEFMGSVEEILEDEKGNDYDFAEQVNDYGRY